MKVRTLCSSALLGAALWALPGTSALGAPKPEAVGYYGLPHDASVNGFRIDDLVYEGAAIMVPLFIAMVIWLLAAAFLWNRKHEASYDHGSWKHPIAAGICAAGIAILAIDDAYSWYESNRDIGGYLWNFENPESKPDVVRIEVNAHQWAWNARYAGPDGKFNTPDDIVTLNDVRAPVGSPVIIELASVDVIHDFFLPNLRVKQDAMPGMINRLTFTAKEAGEFDIACAQHCGVNHYKMKGLLTVMPRSDYDLWAKNASVNSSRLWDPDDGIAHWGWDWTWKKGE